MAREASSSSGELTPTPPLTPPDPSSHEFVAEAGPSAHIRLPTSDSQFSESHPSDAVESSTIQKHLDKRRRASVLPGKKKKQATALQQRQRDPDAAAWFEQLNDVDDKGPAEGAERSITLDLEELRRKMPDAVKMLQDGEDWKGVDLDDGLERGYTWDLMFENQRGIHFLGKAYFSSNSLLPTDPSQFTVPDHPIESASRMTVSGPADMDGPERTLDRSPPAGPTGQTRKPKSGQSKYNPNFGAHDINLSSEHRNIKTAYSLSTAQVPGPQWEWVTPWMINMKTGTDEGGWRYNAWFKQKGWRNHAGPAGWWGWVRRREWVRLRVVRPIRDEQEETVEREDDPAEKPPAGKKKPHKTLSEIVKETSETEVAGAILHAMSSIMLDREKLAWWGEGLRDADAEDNVREGLQKVLDDEDNMQLLRRAFTHRATFSSFLGLLDAHHFHVVPEQAASRLTPPHSPTAPTRSDESP